MLKDELVEHFLKETEATADDEFAAQLDLFYDVTRLTGERRKSFGAVFKEVDEDDSAGLRAHPATLLAFAHGAGAGVRERSEVGVEAALAAWCPW